MCSKNYKCYLVLTILLFSGVVSAQEEQIQQQQQQQTQEQSQQEYQHQLQLEPIGEYIFPSASGKILTQINPPVYEQIPVKNIIQQQQPQQIQQQPRNNYPFTNLGQIGNRNPMSKQFYGSQHSILQFNRQQHPKQIIIEQVLDNNNEPIQTSISPQIEQLQQPQQQQQQQLRQEQQQQQPFVGIREQQQLKQQQLILQQQQFQQQQQQLRKEQQSREQEELEKSIQLHQEQSQQQPIIDNNNNQQDISERADIPVAPIVPELPTISKPIQRNQQPQQKQPTKKPSAPLKHHKNYQTIDTARAVNHQYNDNVQNGDNNVDDITRENNDQAASAHYSFDSSVQDTINDHSHTRQETRDGLSLTGMYSYSDGFFKRTVFYEADEEGYRVTKEEIEPIGDGPQFNPKGKADISSSLIGSYSITANDYKRGIPNTFSPSKLPADRNVEREE